MARTMIEEGALAVELAVRDGHVLRVDVGSSRLVRAASVLSGRAPGDVLRLVPLLFPVCGVAQTIACARAIDAALGRAETHELRAARELLCLAEAASSHVWQLAIAWREAAGVASDAGSVRAARLAVTALGRALLSSEGAGGALREPVALDEVRAAAGDLAARVLELTQSEPPLLDVVRGAGRASFGAPGARVPGLAALDATAVGARLAADPGFAERPDLAGEPVDLSAAARFGTDPEVERTVSEHGYGLLARLLARRAQAAADARSLADAASTLALAQAAAEGGSPATREPGVGVGVASTARGPLVFWVRASEARVDELRVVAPTEWTFHPSGVLASALKGAAKTATLARDAGWLVLALDPCVPWTIEVRDA